MADPETRITELEIRLGFLEAEVGPLLQALRDGERRVTALERRLERLELLLDRALSGLAPPQEG